MEGEMSNFFKVWLSVYFCLCYCYATAKFVPKGCTRLLCFLPIVCLFLYLPLCISSVHLVGTTSFFISWLANFKLLLFAFGKGPLSSQPSISLGCFVALACLPIKIQQQNPPPNPLAKSQKTQNSTNPSPPKSQINDQNKENPIPQNETITSLPKQNPLKSANKPQKTQNETNPSPPKSHTNGQKKENPPLKSPNKPTNHPNGANPSPPKTHINSQNKANPIPQNPKIGHTFKLPLNYATKALILGILLRSYDYSDHIHPKALLLLYCFHIYLLLELILAVAASLARALLGIELELQFNEPYLSTSLQDFWGRRWNLMVTSILRPTVYSPALGVSKRVVGRRWAPLPAVFATFVVSALMHEVVFYHMGRMRPTWEVTCFFLLHGVCLTVEIFLKKAMLTGRWRLPRVVSGFLTLGFVMVTSFWLFIPQFLRFGADVKAFQEYAAIGAFLRSLISLAHSFLC